MVYPRLRALREDGDLTQKDLAVYLHCTQACYSRYELGLREIPLPVLSRLADYYQTSTDYLLQRTDVRKPYPPGKKTAPHSGISR